MTYNPYIKGRWYRIFMESDGTDSKITNADIDATIYGANIKLPKDFHLVDLKYDINSVTHTGNVALAIDVMSFPDSSQGFVAPIAKAFDYAYIYVFGYFTSIPVEESDEEEIEEV